MILDINILDIRWIAKILEAVAGFPCLLEILKWSRKRELSYNILEIP